MKRTAQELAELCNGTVQGDLNRCVDGVQAFAKAGSTDVTYVADKQHAREVAHSAAGIIVISEALLSSVDTAAERPTLILVEDAQAAFIPILNAFRPERPRLKIGIATEAIIASTATIGTNTNVYPGVYIADDVVIGSNCDIYPGVYIGPGCRLGNDVTLHPYVVLYPDIEIGDDVLIHAGAVIGADGFGYRFEAGRYVKIPQRGTVRIENHTEIGACTTVDRGMIGPTIIGEGTKLDNLIMIAHNCELGKHNAFASQVGLAGSVTTGNYVRCAGQVGIGDHVHLHDGCTLAARAGVHTDIPANQTYVGTPARPLEDQARIVLAGAKVPDMRKQLRQLKADVAKLTERMEALVAGAAEEETT